MCFGEIALTQSVPRMATIVCKSETHFAILSRENFNSLLCMIWMTSPILLGSGTGQNKFFEEHRHPLALKGPWNIEAEPVYDNQNV